MVRLVTALDGSRGKPVIKPETFALMTGPPPAPLKTRPDGVYVGLGWDGVLRTDQGVTCFKDGSWFGMRSFMKRQANGVTWVLMFNASMQPDANDVRTATDAVKHIREKLEALEKYPAIDLFDEYR